MTHRESEDRNEESLTIFESIFHGGKCSYDALKIRELSVMYLLGVIGKTNGGIGNDTVLHGYIEVNANEDAL
jgi:hypothetical protein